jgi:hypothetical protein
MMASDPFNLSLLQHAQQRNLSLGRKVADFVQEDGPAVDRLKSPDVSLECACEGAFLVPEEFRSNQGLRN